MTTRDFYDFIVVGAGSAGCALANRLSTDPSISVAVIEAGGSDDREAIQVPRQYFSLWGTDVDWNYVSAPQPGTANRTHVMPRGRVLGGTSSINGMVYLRGAKSNYDGWAAAGCPGWDWESVRPEFEELETWLQPRVLSPLNSISMAMVEAAVQAGFPRSESFDNGKLEGSGWNKSTIVDGRRNSAYRAFLAPVLDRPNLHILTETQVHRLDIVSSRVRGVHAQREGGPLETISAGEVILTSGAFDSPRILMHSGIGPAALGVKCQISRSSRASTIPWFVISYCSSGHMVLSQEI